MKDAFNKLRGVNTLNTDCSILLLSCDKNVDILKLFKFFFEKYWRKCKYKIYIGLEQDKSRFDIGITLQSKEILWSKRVKEYLKKIDTELVLIILDDYIIEQQVNERYINECIQLMEEDQEIANIAFSNIANDGKHDASIKNLVHRSSRGDYLMNYQIGLWRKDDMFKLLKDDENPWQSELFGSIRARRLDNKKFYCLEDDNEMPIKFNRGWLVVQGYWNGNEVKRLENEYDIKIPLGNRPIKYQGWHDRRIWDRITLRCEILFKQFCSNINIYFD